MPTASRPQASARSSLVRSACLHGIFLGSRLPYSLGVCSSLAFLSFPVIRFDSTFAAAARFQINKTYKICPVTMFRIVPIDPSRPSGRKRGRPLHVSLSTSAHDHSDPANAGIVLTVGRTGCDVNFPDMDGVDGGGGGLPRRTVKITATVLEVSGSGPRVPRHTGEYALSLDKNLFDLAWAAAATTDGGRSYGRTVPSRTTAPCRDWTGGASRGCR